MNVNFYNNNRSKFSKMMDNNSLAVFFSGKAPKRSADQDYEFTPNRNFYYLTGINRPNMILCFTNVKNKVEEILFIEKGNPTLEKWLGKRMRKEEAEAVSGVKKIFYLEDFESHLDKLLSHNEVDNIYIDCEPNNDELSGFGFTQKVQKKWPFLRIKNAYIMVSDLRTIKTDEEVNEIRKAIEITNEGIQSLMNNAKAGLMEYQLEAYYDFVLKQHGKIRSFKTIAASGSNATVLHYEDNNTEIKDNDMILFDLGVENNYYCSDITRTFPVSGKYTDRQKEVYNSVLSVQKQMIEMVKPGVYWKDFHNTARSLLAKECIKLGLIEEEKDIIKYYYHGIGHYLGLDTHDVGRYDLNERQLEPGMIITVEPGLYIEEEGIGVRIEDDVLVTENGHENLSKAIIKEVEDIEAFMSKK